MFCRRTRPICRSQEPVSVYSVFVFWADLALVGSLVSSMKSAKRFAHLCSVVRALFSPTLAVWLSAGCNAIKGPNRPVLEATQSNEITQFSLLGRYFQAAYGVSGVICDFHSTWTDNMTKKINIVRPLWVPLLLQSDAKLFKKAYNNPSLFDTLASCTREVNYVAQLD